MIIIHLHLDPTEVFGSWQEGKVEEVFHLSPLLHSGGNTPTADIKGEAPIKMITDTIDRSEENRDAKKKSHFSNNT